MVVNTEESKPAARGERKKGQRKYWRESEREREERLRRREITIKAGG
jgi:hypothetical protein